MHDVGHCTLTLSRANRIEIVLVIRIYRIDTPFAIDLATKRSLCQTQTVPQTFVEIVGKLM